MAEVYTASEVTAELLDPIDGSVITSVSIPYRRDLTISERPVYAQRGYHRSNTLSAAHLRSLGSVTLRKDVESLALAAEIKRWQKGVTFYALSSDLKGQRYRHPHLRVTFTNADGSTDAVTAYNVKLSDRSLSAPDGGIVGDSISLDVLGGFEPKEGGYEPVRALDFARTGTATYLSTAGTLTTAGDGVARITGDGLLLEGGATNQLFPSNSFTVAPWHAGVDATVTDTAILAPDESTTADTVHFSNSLPAAYVGYLLTGLTPETTYTFSVWIKSASGAIKLRLSRTNGLSWTGATVSPTITLTSGWERYDLTYSTGVSETQSDLLIGSENLTPFNADVGTIYVFGAQHEVGPFATSYIPTTTAAATRQADLAGITPPHNLIDYSELQLGFVSPWGSGNFYNDNFPAWASDATAGPNGKPAAKVVIPGGSNGFAPTAIRPITLEAGAVYTISVKVHLSAAGTLRLGFDGTNDGGSYANEGDTPVPANTWVRVKATITTSAAQQYIKVLPKIPGGGTVTITEIQIATGYHPGPYVKTTDTPIPAPASPALDPAWSQNGTMEFDAVLPITPTSDQNNRLVMGDIEGGCNLLHYAGWFYFNRRDTSGGRSITSGPMYAITTSGVKHRYRLEWTNEINEQTGVREMWQRLYIDGVKVAEQDVAALYGATAWADIDPSRLVSDGNVFSVLGDLITEYPTPRSGYRPA